MSDEIVKEMSPKEEKKTFSVSKKIDNVTRRVEGEQVENGWIITISKDWRDEKDNWQ